MGFNLAFKGLNNCSTTQVAKEEYSLNF